MSISRLRRNTDQRQALLRDLVTDLILNERINTTYAKAKEVAKLAEWLITIAKVGNEASYRKLASIVRFEIKPIEKTVSKDDKEVKAKKSKKSEKQKEKTKPVYAIEKLIKTIAPRYSERHGGYTRIIKTDIRRGDAALMSIIEFV